MELPQNQQVGKKLEKMQVSLRKQITAKKIKQRRQQPNPEDEQFAETSCHSPQQPQQMGGRIYQLLMQKPVQKQPFSNIQHNQLQSNNLIGYLQETYEPVQSDLPLALQLIGRPEVHWKVSGLWCLRYLIIHKHVNSFMLFSQQVLDQFVEQLAQSVQCAPVLNGYIDVIGALVNVEARPLLDKLMSSKYPQIAVTILSQIELGNVKIRSQILWQIGLLCTEECSQYSNVFFDLNIIEVMLKLKHDMGESWKENHVDLGPMFCYVFNSFTWDYQANGVLDSSSPALLMPCIPFLQDEVLFSLHNRLDLIDDDDLVGLCEMLTTIEAIISIGMQKDLRSNFLAHPQADDLLRGMFQIYSEQCQYLIYLSQSSEDTKFASDFDISKEVMIQITNMLQCLMQESEEESAQNKMVQAGIIDCMKQATYCATQMSQIPKTRDDILYSILDIIQDLCQCQCSFQQVIEAEGLLENVFTMTIEIAGKWNAALNLEVVNIVRNLSECCEKPYHFERLCKIGMPQVMLTILALYYKKSDNICQGILMTFENLISLVEEIPQFMQQCELFQTKEGLRFSDMIEVLCESRNDDLQALANDIMIMYSSVLNGSDSDDLFFSNEEGLNPFTDNFKI